MQPEQIQLPLPSKGQEGLRSLLGLGARAPLFPAAPARPSGKWAEPCLDVAHGPPSPLCPREHRAISLLVGWVGKEPAASTLASSFD